MDEQLITASEFARRMKVSPAAVTKAIKSGRITPAENPGKSGVWLNPETAAKQWTDNSRFRIEAGKAQELQENTPKLVLLPTKKRKQPEPEDILPALPEDSDAPSIAKSRAKFEKYNADLAQLKYETLSGKLVDAEEVLYEWKRIILSVRGHFLAMSSKMKVRCPELNDNQITVLEDLVRETLEEMAVSNHDNP